MIKILTVGDFFRLKDDRLVVGGINPELDNLDDNEIKEKIGKNIFIRDQEGNIKKYNVLDIQTSSSIIDKKNIFILLSKDADESDFKIGLSIYINNDK